MTLNVPITFIVIVRRNDAHVMGGAVVADRGASADSAAGHVDDDRQGADGAGFAHGAGHVVVDGDVAISGDDRGAELLSEGSPAGLVPVEHHDPHAPARQTADGFGAETAGAAGDDGDPSHEFHLHSSRRMPRSVQEAMVAPPPTRATRSPTLARTREPSET